jgi:N-acylneuraminate cytidylyltransferase
VPFIRPAELAGDETPMWPVVRHAVAELGARADEHDALLLLQPTSPFRLPGDVAGAVAALSDREDAGGVVGVSQPSFNPIWTGVVERDGVLEDLFPDARVYARRQDVPRVLRINGAIYLWPLDVVHRFENDPRGEVPYLPLRLPERRALDIDTEEDLQLAELLLSAGIVRLPWLD